MEVPNCVDGLVPDWEISGDDRCICDVRATFITKLTMSKKDFERGVSRLARRRSARAEYISRRLSTEFGDGFRLVDENASFEIHDKFEEIFGREPLDAFIVDMEEVSHQYLGGFFSHIQKVGLTVSPMSAGQAILITPSRSFVTPYDYTLWDQRTPCEGNWHPCVRTEMTFLLAGSLDMIGSANASFISSMAELGIMSGFETTIRKPDLANIPYVLPTVRLAPASSNRDADAG